MTSPEALEVECYMRSEANRLLARDPSEFVAGLRETMERLFLGKDNKPPAMLAIANLADNIGIKPVTVGSLACEWVCPEEADFSNRMLYLHGGGMVSGSARTHRALASRIAARTGMPVLVPDYRLAPEHFFPAALEDCVNLLNWLGDNAAEDQSAAEKLFLVGDSAGGGLVLSVLVNCRDQLAVTPSAGATFSALADFTASGDSAVSNQETDVLLSREALQGLGTIYSGGTRLDDPRMSPLFGDITGLPPLHMQASDSEVMQDDSVRFFDRHKASGGEGELKIYSNMVHGWQAFAPYLPEAEKSLDEMASFFRRYV